MNEVTTLRQRSVQLFLGLMLAMVMPGLAIAQEATFDPQTIVTKITTYAGYALVLLLAFAAAVWGLRAAGLIGGKR